MSVVSTFTEDGTTYDMDECSTLRVGAVKRGFPEGVAEGHIAVSKHTIW